MKTNRAICKIGKGKYINHWMHVSRHTEHARINSVLLRHCDQDLEIILNVIYSKRKYHIIEYQLIQRGK